ncbi:MAG: lipopolysaccharide biosynthesis protein [Odoribacter splanchnicus]|jgi:O-antigen/teichoic acid export membrane protein|nr:lipopolysaccharide biosynthesis protein [Odoribacter splanchnicus]MBT9662754.1 lipopolysaccharide biosynthesis protein [Odoribacter splanchnicus]
MVSSNTKRLAKNTLMLYFRQFLIIVVNLYTVRVVLNTLGASDYGIYNVIAGTVTMLGFLSNSMAMASQRFFSFELGRGDEIVLQKTFAVTLFIYVGLALGVILFAETIGLWFVYNKLVIPLERMNAALWIYQFAILTFVVKILTTPYMSAIIAHEDMSVYAYVSIIEVVLNLLIVFVLSVLPYDKLILYGFLMLIVVSINTALYRFYCSRHYKECCFRLLWDKVLLKNIGSYVGWNFFGSFCVMLKDQGVNILLNLFFGTLINAAQAIASQVNGAIMSFAQNFTTALRPQIIKSYAVHKNDEALRLVFSGSKFIYFLMYLFVMPLVLEMPYVLKLWLKNPPEYSILFTRLVLINAAIESVIYPMTTLVQATGKMRLYQIVVGTILLLNFPISYVILKLRAPAYAVLLVMIFITVIAILVRLYIVKYLIDYSIRLFVKKVIVPIVLVSVIGIIFPYVVRNFYEESFGRLCLTVSLAIICSGVAIFIIGLTQHERLRILTYLEKKFV